MGALDASSSVNSVFTRRPFSYTGMRVLRSSHRWLCVLTVCHAFVCIVGNNLLSVAVVIPCRRILPFTYEATEHTAAIRKGSTKRTFVQ